MATAIYMPKEGMAMEEGVLVRWLKNVGDKVELNDPIMEIETDKITMEAEAPASGYILAELVNAGATVPVLSTMGWIGEKGEAIPAAEGAAPATAAEAPAEEAPAAPAAAAAALKADGGFVPATPYARKLAADKGVSLSDVTPTGANGAVVAADVENAAKASPLAKRVAEANGVSIGSVQGTGFGGKVMKADVLASSAAPAPKAGKPDLSLAFNEEESRVTMSGMRRVIAARMSQSSAEIPACMQQVTVDVTELMKLREQINEGREKAQRISINDLVLKACAIAVADTPAARTRLDGEDLVVMKRVNVSMAVSTGEGLLVPVILDADKISLSALSAAAKDLAARAKSNKLKPDEMLGGVFTVSNLGMYSVDSFTPIINQPEAAILGVCRVKDELALENGEIVVRKMMPICLVFDHRILDGASAAEFEVKIKNLLENPLNILV